MTQQEAPEIVVKTMLKRSTFRRLYLHSQEMGTTVAVLLAAVADRSVAPDRARAPQRRTYRRVTADELDRAIACRELQMTWGDIGRELGVKPGTIRAAVIREIATRGSAQGGSDE